MAARKRGIRFHRVRASTAEEAQGRQQAAEARKARLKKWLRRLDFRRLDLFGYEPDYTFPGYRSSCGAVISVVLFLAVMLRCVTMTIDFIYPTAYISENRLLFERNARKSFEAPKFGLIFKRQGWRPFYDPTYFTFRFRQGHSGRASNSTYTDLGDRQCSFVDQFGRIVEDEARCPDLLGRVVGNFFDETFNFVHVGIMRCHNGTDRNGRAKPGPCRRPDEIDDLIYTGTVTIAMAETDLDIQSMSKVTPVRTLKKQFRRGWHPTYDIYFTVRYVTVQPRAFFDSLAEDMRQKFVLYDHMETSYTDFRPVKLGRWNVVDPKYQPQYASFFFMLSEEYIDQQRSYMSTFKLVEAWGATLCFFYGVFRTLAHRWNKVHFLREVKGLDLRDLSRDQFDHFGRLHDRSFQIPRELQDLHTVANVN